MKTMMWNADLGNGMYKNPILYADYSDPDACRVCLLSELLQYVLVAY